MIRRDVELRPVGAHSPTRGAFECAQGAGLATPDEVADAVDECGFPGRVQREVVSSVLALPLVT